MRVNVFLVISCFIVKIGFIKIVKLLYIVKGKSLLGKIIYLIMDYRVGLFVFSLGYGVFVIILFFFFIGCIKFFVLVICLIRGEKGK